MMSYGLQLDHIAINVKEKMDEYNNQPTFLPGKFN